MDVMYGASTHQQQEVVQGDCGQMTENFILEEFPTDDLLPDLSYQFKETVNNIRKIVKSLRYVNDYGRTDASCIFYIFGTDLIPTGIYILLYF
jgi:hypothetical protein